MMSSRRRRVSVNWSERAAKFSLKPAEVRLLTHSVAKLRHNLSLEPGRKNKGTVASGNIKRGVYFGSVICRSQPLTLVPGPTWAKCFVSCQLLRAGFIWLGQQQKIGCHQLQRLFRRPASAAWNKLPGWHVARQQTNFCSLLIAAGVIRRVLCKRPRVRCRDASWTELCLSTRRRFSGCCFYGQCTGHEIFATRAHFSLPRIKGLRRTWELSVDDERACRVYLVKFMS